MHKLCDALHIWTLEYFGHAMHAIQCLHVLSTPLLASHPHTNAEEAAYGMFAQLVAADLSIDSTCLHVLCYASCCKLDHNLLT